MPRIERVRIVGLKYEKMLKRFDNMIIDFCNDDGPENTLITLVNGGGKGVLYQAIFQLLLPKTKWGKKDNHVESFFYNSKKQLHPYTFHVAIEWRLDNTESPEFITTGIAMTVNHTVDKEVKVDYLLYIVAEYGDGAEINLDTLPLINEDLNQPTSFETIQNFVKNQRNLIIPYGSRSNDLKKYYDFLKERDIHVDEWKNMKKINAQEGGIQGYFEKHNALTNDKLFENLILPEIGAGLNDGQRDEENSLHKMFLDSAIVAQRLPQLEAREYAYKDFITLAMPLKQLVEQGIQASDAYDEHQKQGCYLSTAIKEQLIITRNEQQKWKQEFDQYLARKEKLKFDSENLKYLFLKEKCDAKQEEFRQFADDDHRAETKWLDSKDKENSFEIAYSLAQRKEKNDEISQLTQEIAAYRQSNSLSDKQGAMSFLKDKLECQWSIASKHWQAILSQFHEESSYLRAELNSIEKLKDRATEEIGRMEATIEETTKRIRKYNEEYINMTKEFDQETLNNPKYAIQRLNSSILRQKENIVHLGNQVKTATIKKESLLQSKSTFEERVSSVEKEIEKIQRLLHIQQKRESQLWDRIIVLIERYEDNATTETKVLFTSEEIIRREFSRRIDEVDHQLKRSRREHFSLKVDVDLQHEEFWIPNPDILAVKDVIEALNIECTLGTEYLSGINEVQRGDEVSKHPLLPYGVIIKKIDESRYRGALFNDILLKSPVPIFVREEMSATHHSSFSLPGGDSSLLALNPTTYLEWRGKLQDLLKKKEQSVQDNEGYLNKLKACYQEYDYLLSGDVETSNMLITRLDQTIELSRQHKSDLAIISTDIDGTIEKIKEDERTLDVMSKEVHLQTQKVSKLTEWIQRLSSHEEDENQKRTSIDRKKILEGEQQEFSRQMIHIRQRTDTLKDNHKNWISATQQGIFPRLQKCLDDIVFPEYETNDNIVPVEENTSNDTLDALRSTLVEWEGLQQSYEMNQGEIRTRDALIEQARKRVDDLEMELARKDNNWKMIPIPNEDKATILDFQVRQKEITTILHDEYRTIHDNYTRSNTEAERMLSDLNLIENNINNTHNRPVEQWSCSLKQKEVEIKEDIKDNELLINECTQVMEVNKEAIEIYNSSSILLNSHIDLESNANDIPVGMRERIKEKGSCEIEIKEWIDINKETKQTLQDMAKRVKIAKVSLGDKISKSGWNSDIESKIKDSLNSATWEDFYIANTLLASMMKSSSDQIHSIQTDKENMDFSRKMWVGRASKRVIQIIEILRRMEKRMVIPNQNEYLFPLVKLNYKNITIPKTAEDAEGLLTEFFNKNVQELQQKYPKIEHAPIHAIQEKVNDGRVVFAALQNRYPLLQIYKPTTENYFIYARPEEYHYSEWEVINKGAVEEAGGSGGQTQSVQLLVAMMIMTHKRVNRENKGWTVFLYDNPFGEMVSKNVLDPVFEISKILKFQWCIVTPPELVKNDVSTRFGVYWHLNFGGSKGDSLETTLVKGGRKLTPLTLF